METTEMWEKRWPSHTLSPFIRVVPDGSQMAWASQPLRR